jgi:hypothetical protein
MPTAALRTLILGIAGNTLAAAALAASPDGGDTIALFDGESLAGWHVFLDDPSIDSGSAWKASGGVLSATGVGKGYVRTEVPYADYRLHVEWRWPKTPGNSGVVLHVVNGDVVWPKGFEAQLKVDRAGDIVMFGDARGREEVLGRNPSGVSTGRVERPGPSREKSAGEWNSYDVTCSGGTITLAVNGEEVNRVRDVVPNAGYIGLQTEGTPIDFRNVTLTPLPPAKNLNAPMPVTAQ